jgi:phenylalanyl-tRNA synthetase beta chain
LQLEVNEPKAAPYRPLPTTPAIERDLALVLPPGVSAEVVGAVLSAAGGPLLEALAVFDEYRGPGGGVPAEHRSVGFRCRFREPSRTLRENEVDAILAAALRQLEEELGVRRRAAG